MATTTVGRGLTIDTSEIKGFAQGVRLIVPTLYPELRNALKDAARPIAEQAKRNANSYSKRIPGTVKVRASGVGSVSIVAGGPKAPEAVALENKGRGFVRHPLFGNRNYWYDGPWPAFLTPAFRQYRDLALVAITAAVNATIDEMAKAGEIV